jgi:hypothetical protein
LLLLERGPFFFRKLVLAEEIIFLMFGRLSLF